MWPGHAQACAHAKGQKSMKRTSQILILTAALTMLAGEARADLYTFTTINVPGAAWTNVNGINDAGQIVGSYQDASFNFHGFLGVGGVLTTVDQPNASSTNVNGINNSGQIVGWGSPTPGVQASGGSFLDVGGVFTTINVPGEVYGISNKGQMVGSYVDASGANHGFLNVGGVFTTVDEPGAWLTAARGVNSTGQVVGYYYGNTGVHGFLDIGGVFTTINVPGASYTYAYGIN